MNSAVIIKSHLIGRKTANTMDRCRLMGKTSDLFHRALIAYSDQNFERAEHLAKELINIDENNVDGWSLLANIYQQLKQYDQAVIAAKHATDLEPENIQHWNNLGYLYLLQGKWQEGEQCYAKAASLPDPSPTIFLNHAWALIELGQTEKAQKQLQLAVDQALEDTLKETIQTDEKYHKLRPLLK